MLFRKTKLAGAYIIEVERREDPRGFFARAFCAREFAAFGLESSIAQANLSHNIREGTLRGLHFQYPPAAEVKLVRCTRGAILDVIVDLRPESETYLEHLAVELSEGNRRALYVPQRFAHGFQALADGTDLLYTVSEFYTPALDSGLSFKDPRLGITEWRAVSAISEKDGGFAFLATVEPELKRRMAVQP